MKPSEIKEFKLEALKRLPSVGAWLSSPANAETVELWGVELWSDLELTDCLTVLRALMADERFEMKPWEMDRFGALLKSKVKAIEWEHEERSRARRTTVVSARGSMGAVLRKINGVMSEHAKRAILAEEFPDDDGPRYKCGLCFDHGVVTVYAGDSMAAAIRVRDGQISTFHPYTVTVACTCDHRDAERFRSYNPDSRGLRLPEYGPHMVICNSATREAQLQELAIWAASYTPGKKHDEFEAWNRGEVEV